MGSDAGGEGEKPEGLAGATYSCDWRWMLRMSAPPTSLERIGCHPGVLGLSLIRHQRELISSSGLFIQETEEADVS